MISVFDDPDEIKEVNEYDKDIDAIIREAGSKLKEERKKKKLSQEKLGSLVGISQKVVYFIESGNNFEYKTYIKLCLAMQIKPYIGLRNYVSKKK